MTTNNELDTARKDVEECMNDLESVKKRLGKKIEVLEKKYTALCEASQAPGNANSELSEETLSKDTEEKRDQVMETIKSAKEKLIEVTSRDLTTAPQIEVPMDFRMELLGSPSHGNLTLELAPGVEPVMVNTAIMSYNSPVIYRLTTELYQNTVDVVEFSREAVLFFSRACYSGQLDELGMDIFRHVYKMVVVFKVCWMENRCVKLFGDFVKSIVQKEYVYEDFLVFYNEAEFSSGQLKKEELSLAMLSKLKEFPEKIRRFISDFTVDIDDLSISQIENLIATFKSEGAEDFAKVLIRAFDQNTKAITTNCSLILSNVDLVPCFDKDRCLLNSFQQSVDSIDSFSSKDMKTISRIYTGLLG